MSKGRGTDSTLRQGLKRLLEEEVTARVSPSLGVGKTTEYLGVLIGSIYHLKTNLLTTMQPYVPLPPLDCLP